MENDNPQVNTQTRPDITQNVSKFQLSKLPAVPVIGGVLIILLLIAVGIFLLRPTTSSKNVSELINNAEKQATAGNYKEAQVLYQTALKADSKNENALSGIIYVYSIEGNLTGTEEEKLSESKQYIERALDLYSNNPQILENAGYAYETAGDYEKALELYTKAAKLDPEDSNAWFHMGHAFQFLGRNQEALSAYEKAASIDPDNPQVLMAQGNQLMSEGDAEGSYLAFLKASNQSGLTNEVKAEALTGAASARAMQNNLQYVSDTLKLSKQAVDTSPNFSPALATYGYTLYLTSAVEGDKNEAFDYLNRAIEANPRISKNYLTLSKFYRVKEDFANAIKYGKQAVERADEDNTLLSQKARMLNKGNYEYELAKTYYLANQRDLVIPMLKLAIADNPSIKKTAKVDFASNGQFMDFATSGEFISLIAEK